MEDVWEPLGLLARNVGVLLALILVRNLVQAAWTGHGRVVRSVVDGLLFGAAGLLSMLLPLEVGPGVIVDTRVVVVAMAGIFGGPVAGVLAVGLTVAGRMTLGGVGAAAGVGATLGGGVIGLIAQRKWAELTVLGRPMTFLVLGMALAVQALLWTPLLPVSMAERFHYYAVPVLVFYPLAAVLMGQLLQQLGREEQVSSSLRRKEALLGAISEALPDRISVLDRHGRFIEVLGGAGEVARDDLRGARLEDVVSSTEAARCLAAIRETLDTKCSRTIEYVVERGGRTRWREARTSVLEEADGPRLVVWAARDVTSRKAAEAELRESERRYRLLFDSASDILVVLTGGVDDRPLRFLEMNAEGLAVLGYTGEALRDASPVDLLTRTAAAELSGHLQRLGRDGQAFFNTTVRRRDGTALELEVNAQLCDLAGRPAILAIARDVTRRARLEQEVRQAQRLESVGRLAGGIAHDFNNLLTVILNYLRFLSEDARSEDDTWRADLDAARQAAQRAASLTRQLLAFSRSQAMHPEPVDLAEVVCATGGLLERFIGEDIELVIDTPDEPVVVEADPTQLEQIIVNLAVNARDAMPRGGRLELVTTVEDQPPGSALHVGTSSASERWAHLAVRDTGVGMDETVRRRVFEPFFTTKGPEEGTGLGLATVHGIVTQSGGAVRVDSAPGDGTTFHIHLPVVEGGARAPHPTTGDYPAIRWDSPHVLLVEDEAEVRDVVSRMLELAGYEVSVARSAEEALELMSNGGAPVRVLLADVVLPRMSGPELARRLQEERPDLSVLLISGYANDELERHGLNEAHYPVLRKPFGSGVLTARLDELLAPE
ncbi:MAG: PAS domain S-box protein [Myxococcota bacterium]